VSARASAEGGACFLVGRDATGVSVGEAVPTIGLHGVDQRAVVLAGARLEARDLLGGIPGRGEAQRAAALDVARLWVAATAVGVAQAAFEAALRYSQQRTTFGKPINQHQAIQLVLADMATKTAAARLLTYAAAAGGPGDPRLARAKTYAAEVACDVALASMRVHGGYGYTTEFPIERYYRDAAHLPSTPLADELERCGAAEALVAAHRAR
jgi:alkylation response protein AidB-like acyl-CoA dehydrogenase